MYQRILQTLQEPIELQTLGRRSFILVRINQEHIEIINAAGRIYSVNEELFHYVFERYNQLPIESKATASQYADPKWPETPNRNSSPYIAAIIHHFSENP